MKKLAGLIMFLLAIVSIVGTADALPSIEIQPTSGSPYVKDDGTILVPVGVDAYDTIGLAAYYTGGWSAGNPYSVWVEDSGAHEVWRHDSTGGLAGDDDLIELHWTPDESLDGQTLTLVAEGVTSQGVRRWTVQATAPTEMVPELPTSALTMLGLIGLIGIVRLRKK